MLRGSPELRNLQLSKVLCVLAAFGVQVAMPKGERGRRVQWIGTTFELHAKEIVLGTPQKKPREIKETLSSSVGYMIATRDLRSFLGKLAWVAKCVGR